MVKHLEYIIGEPWIRIVFEDGSYEILSERSYVLGRYCLEDIRYTDSGELRFHFLFYLSENTLTRITLGVKEFVKMVTEINENPNICYDENSKTIFGQQFFGGF